MTAVNCIMTAFNYIVTVVDCIMTDVSVSRDCLPFAIKTLTVLHNDDHQSIEFIVICQILWLTYTCIT